MSEIAKEADVSRATVSLVLRGSTLIAPPTAEKVREAAKHLGYVYNRTAAALRNRRTHTVGLIEANFKNPFFGAMSEAVERELEQEGKALLFVDSAESLERQRRAIQLMIENGVDGILLCPVKRTTPEDLSLLRESTVPLVFFSRYIPGFNADYVGGANFSGAYLAVKRIVELGHRRIVFVGGEPTASPWMERVGGYRKALEESGLPCIPPERFCSEVSMAGGAALAEKVSHWDPSPTAALCYNDSVAFGFMLGLEKRGVLPGKDFAVVGFDDLPIAKLWRPPLATVSCPPAQVGKWAIRVLLEKLAGTGGLSRKIEIQSVLVERDSLCPIRL